MITLVEAFEYFNNERLFADKWLQATTQVQTQSLKMSENQIKMLNLNTDIDLDNEVDFKKAIFEQALYLVETQNSNRSKLIEQGVTSFSVEGLSESYDINKSTVNKKVCSEAMIYLKKYLLGGFAIC